MTSESFNLISVKHKGCPLCAMDAKGYEEGTFEYPEIVYASIDLQEHGSHHAGICKKHGIFSADPPKKFTPEEQVNMSDPEMPTEHQMRIAKFISHLLSTGYIGVRPAKDPVTGEYRSVLGYSTKDDPEAFKILGHLTPGNEEDLDNHYEFFD